MLKTVELKSLDASFTLLILRFKIGLNLKKSTNLALKFYDF